MKKSLLALSLLATFAGSAMANVSVYGVLDVGFGFENHKIDKFPGITAQAQQELIDSGVLKLDQKNNSFKMTKDWYAGPRFGLTGSEKVSDNLSVCFKLESGFSPLNGALNNLLFQRESTLNAATPFGTVYVGHMGVIRGGAGSVGFFNSQANPFGGGWDDVIGGVSPFTSDFAARVNNGIAYVSPTISDLKIYAQYSGGETDSQNKSTDDRYMALGALFSHDKLNVAAVIDTTILGNGAQYNPLTLTYTAKAKPSEDLKVVADSPKKNPISFNVAANYEFDAFKLYGSAQYFKNAKNVTNSITGAVTLPKDTTATIRLNDVAPIFNRLMDPKKNTLKAVSPDTKAAVYTKENATYKYDGFGLTTGISAPLANGTIYASIGYMQAKGYDYLGTKYQVSKLTRYGIGLGYDYKLSQRTTVYAGIGGIQDTWKAVEFDAKVKQHIYQAGFGLSHKF